MTLPLGVGGWVIEKFNLCVLKGQRVRLRSSAGLEPHVAKFGYEIHQHNKHQG